MSEIAVVGAGAWGTALAIVLGRELFMTVFRQFAARRGVVIAAIGPAKWKTGLQLVWIGSGLRHNLDHSLVMLVDPATAIR